MAVAGIDGTDIWIKAGEQTEMNAEYAIDVGIWEKLSVLSGIPKAGCEIIGNEFPSDLGSDKWAVDFRKGCYLGQEIVSRIENVGQTKKKLFLLETAKPLKIDEEVVVSGTKIGNSTRKSIQIEKIFGSL